jgi:hypothetical protein
VTKSGDDLAEKTVQLELDLNDAHAREKALSDLLEKKLSEVYIHYHISRTIGSLLDLRELLRQVFDIIKNPCTSIASRSTCSMKNGKISSLSFTADSTSPGKSRSGSAKARLAES